MESWDELLERQLKERDDHPTIERRAGLEARYRRDVERLEYRERQEAMAAAQRRRQDEAAAEERKRQQDFERRVSTEAAADASDAGVERPQSGRCDTRSRFRRCNHRQSSGQIVAGAAPRN